LVLNTGIVDPLYHGPLSGTTINFRDTPFTIKRGDSFLRLVFETIEPTPPATPIPPEIPRKVYIAEKLILAQHYPRTFLNLHRTAHLVSNQLLGKERSTILWIMGIVGAIFVVITIVLTQWQAIPPFTKGTSDELKKTLEESQKTAKELQGTLEDAKKNSKDAKDAERTQQVLEAQAKTIEELRANNEDLRKRLAALESKTPPEPKPPMKKP
jgi:hypothetical protein